MTCPCGPSSSKTHPIIRSREASWRRPSDTGASSGRRRRMPTAPPSEPLERITSPQWRTPVLLLVLIAGIVLGIASLPGHAQECAPAGAAVEVHASITGSDTLSVSYTVVNKTRTGLLWMRIGAGGQERTHLVPQQTPV